MTVFLVSFSGTNQRGAKTVLSKSSGLYLPSAAFLPVLRSVLFPSFLAGILLSGVSGCRMSSFYGPDPGRVLGDAAASLPQLRFEKITLFPGEQLYDYMNGAAVTYLEQGFRVLGACDVFQNATQAKIELFQMASQEDAEAVFEEFAMGTGGIEFGPGGGGKYWSGTDSEGIFQDGPFFVRIMVYSKSPETAALLAEKIGRAVDDAI